MSRSSDTFAFPGELGLRLRGLRREAGVSIEELTRRMGRTRGYRSHVSRLERGQLAFPSLALVADYLRAVRASFADILDLLDAYTARPEPLEEAGRARILGTQYYFYNLKRVNARVKSLPV